MKSKATKMIGIGFLVAALAVPSVVLAHGWGRGHMMDNWGMGPGAMTPHDRGYSTLTPEQRTQLDQLHRRFYDETADLRKDLWNKSAELNTLLSATDPDLEKVKTLNKEINDLRAKLDEKSLNYQLEARKVTPDTQFGDGYGRFHRPHMRGFGRGGMRIWSHGFRSYGIWRRELLVLTWKQGVGMKLLTPRTMSQEPVC